MLLSRMLLLSFTGRGQRMNRLDHLAQQSDCFPALLAWDAVLFPALLLVIVIRSW